ncbi:MAG: transporter, partial [Pseudonocardiales bacterium]
MIWLTMRQLRTQAAAVYAVVAAAAVVLALTGGRLIDLARINRNVFDQLTRADRNLYYSGIIALAVAPAIIGVFWGAPMVARELEAGTHRLVWNQSVTRTRWLATKLGLTAAAAAAAVGILTWAVTWWSRPIDGSVGNTHGALPARLTPVAFAMRGIAPVGYTVFALVLGVAFGVVLRRSLPAMAITLAVFTFVQIAEPLWVRPHLLSPAVQTATFSDALQTGFQIRGDASGKPVQIMLNVGGPTDWVLSNTTVDGAGKPAALPTWFAACVPTPPATDQAPRAVGGDSRKTMNACLARLTREGYRQR